MIKNSLIPRKSYKHKEPLPRDFVDEVIRWLEFSYKQLNDSLTDSNIAASFIFMFSVLENISSRIINVDQPIKVQENPNKYQFEFRKDHNRLKLFVEDKSNPGFYKRTTTNLESNRNLPWIFKILNTVDFISDLGLSETDLNNIIKKRNDIIHANNTTGTKFDVDRSNIIFLNGIK